ncbi:tyrosine 3-monooxygenase-like [Liolophura sinensis]|uniref:tyrosine 3-monooxygenase-like n=1 Tax=Liolophura sinensis TaxID=3198878 RepID=UPI00315954B8
MMTTDTESAKRRLAFQKSYSLETKSSWRRKSLIEDAKFDTVTNAEFEKREKTLSRGDSITEEDEVFSSNGEAHSVPDKEAAQKICLVLVLRDGLGSLSRILKTFENSKVDISHIESRPSLRSEAAFEIYLRCNGQKNAITVLTNTLKQSSSILDLTVTANDEESKDVWFPRHIADLDKCNHLVTKFEPDLDYDHPGFADKVYRQRRQKIADIAFNYRHGQEIPRVEYVEDEIKTWGHVYSQLKRLLPTHACREYLHVFDILERECGYCENRIPQLQDVSNFMRKRTGFQLRPVSGLLSARDFLASLAFRVFQCTQYVRHGSKPDHSPEPDCIHELLGHVPMLADRRFAQFSQEIGLASLGAADEDIEKIATLYWFTVEFGLLKQDGGLRAYGAGALSSYGELLHALGDGPKKLPFDPETTAVQEYTDDDFQPIYFVVESFDDMQTKMRQYAAKIKRPYEVVYDPYTETIEPKKTKDVISSVADNITQELNNLRCAMEKITSISVKS